MTSAITIRDNIPVVSGVGYNWMVAAPVGQIGQLVHSTIGKVHPVP